MYSSRSLNLVQVFSHIKVKKTGIIVLLEIILLQTTPGCNPGRVSPTPLSTPTTSPMTTATITLTNSPTRFSTSTSTLSPTTTPDYSHTIEKRVILSFDIFAVDNNKSFLDLDKMGIGDTPQCDLQFSISKGTMIVGIMQPLNGALSKSMGRGNIKLDECRGDTGSYTEYHKADTFKGSHICFISNEDRYYLLYLENIVQQTHIFTLYLLVTSYV
jgi:hypothetical protein